MLPQSLEGSMFEADFVGKLSLGNSLGVVLATCLGALRSNSPRVCDKLALRLRL